MLDQATKSFFELDWDLFQRSATRTTMKVRCCLPAMSWLNSV